MPFSVTAFVLVQCGLFSSKQYKNRICQVYFQVIKKFMFLVCRIKIRGFLNIYYAFTFLSLESVLQVRILCKDTVLVLFHQSAHFIYFPNILDEQKQHRFIINCGSQKFSSIHSRHTSHNWALLMIYFSFVFLIV